MKSRPCAIALVFSALLLGSQLPASGQSDQGKPDIHYVPTPQQLVDVMLQMAAVKKGDVVYDLGCGDGRLVIRAAKNHGARGIGIDIDPQRIAEATKNAEAAKVEDRVQFREANIFASDFRDASVITLYLLDSINVRLRPHIFEQVKPGTRVVSHAFRMGDWEPDESRQVKITGSNYDAFFWVVPANVSGRWKVSGQEQIKGMPREILVEQSFQRITAKAADSGTVLGEGKVEGTECVLMLNQGGIETPTTFRAKIEGGKMTAKAMTGRARWNAARESGTEKPLEPAVPAEQTPASAAGIGTSTLPVAATPPPRGD